MFDKRSGSAQPAYGSFAPGSGGVWGSAPPGPERRLPPALERLCLRVQATRGRGRPMSRRHADVVEVRRRDDVPEQFLWRNRLYQVREVLGHWVESGAWWRSAPSSAMIDGSDPAATTSLPSPDDLVLGPIPASPQWAQRAWGEPAPDVGASVGP